MAINGSGNHNKDPDKNVVHFPTLAERDRARKEQAKQEKKAQAAANPFFNFGKVPPFAKFLAASFVAIHIAIFLILSDAAKLNAFYMFGFVPGYYTGALGEGFQWFGFVGPITHMFIHGGWMHLLMNTCMTLALGTFFEKLYGTRAAIIFFFACGLAGAAIYFIFSPYATVPVIGASGGLSGFFGALLMSNLGPRFAARRGPWPMIGFWVAFMILAGVLSGENMAWQAHLGGFAMGIGLTILMQKGKLRL